MIHYLPGGAARKESFYNREMQLKTIIDGGWTWVCGQRRIGKTSLLFQLEVEAEKRKWLPLFLELTTLEEFSGKGLFETFLLSHSRLLKKHNIRMNDFPLDHPAECFYQLVSDVVDEGRQVIFLWDEAEILIEIEKNDPGILNKLRARLSHLRGFRFVLSATQLLSALYDHQSELVSSFLNTFHWMPLSPLEMNEAKALLRCEQTGGWPSKLAEKVVNEAVIWSGGHTLILHELGIQIAEKTRHDGRRANSQILRSCYERLTRDINLRKIIEDDHAKLTKDQQFLLKKVIEADGMTSLDAIASGDKKLLETLEDALRFLVNYGYVSLQENDQIRLRFIFYPEFLPSEIRSAADSEKVNQIRHTIFISYCQNDKKYLDALKVHLNPLIRKTEIDAWDDQRIQPGEAWLEEIEKALKRAQVVVLLISPDFLNSPFITEKEIPKLLTKTNEKNCRILCLFIQHSVVDEISYDVEEEKIKLTKFQGLNSYKKPLDALKKSERDKLLANCAKEIVQQTRSMD